jgi:hypothetical protein
MDKVRKPNISVSNLHIYQHDNLTSHKDVLNFEYVLFREEYYLLGCVRGVV